jgi:two-component system phosphate regulon response regulator PhoB
MIKPLALVIEDDVDLVEIFSQAIQGAGYTVEVCTAGDTGIKRLAEITPHLVILDLHLPGLSGQEVLRRIRANPAMAATTVFIVSADPQTAEITRSLSDLVLIKPVSFQQLRELASRYYRRHTGTVTRPIGPPSD